MFGSSSGQVWVRNSQPMMPIALVIVHRSSKRSCSDGIWMLYGVRSDTHYTVYSVCTEYIKLYSVL